MYSSNPLFSYDVTDRCLGSGRHLLEQATLPARLDFKQTSTRNHAGAVLLVVLKDATEIKTFAFSKQQKFLHVSEKKHGNWRKKDADCGKPLLTGKAWRKRNGMIPGIEYSSVASISLTMSPELKIFHYHSIIVHYIMFMNWYDCNAFLLIEALFTESAVWNWMARSENTIQSHSHSHSKFVISHAGVQFV